MQEIHQHRVLCDIDGVLANFDKAFKQAGSLVVGRELKGSAKVWDLATNYGLTKAEHDAIWASPALTQFILDAAPFHCGIELAKKYLSKESAYCTARGVWLKYDNALEHRIATLRWLARMGCPDLPIFFATDKVKIAQRFGFDAAVDDCPANVEAYLQAGIRCFMPVHAYNRHVVNVDRLEGWY